MDIRKIKRFIKNFIKSIIAIVCLTLMFLALFWYIAVIINFFVPTP